MVNADEGLTWCEKKKKTKDLHSCLELKTSSTSFFKFPRLLTADARITLVRNERILGQRPV